MKMTNRQRNSLIIHIFFYTVLLILLISLCFSFFYPKVISLEQKKNDTRALYTAIQNIEKSGVGFEEFQSLTNNIEKSSYLSEVLKSIEKDFYIENIMSTDFERFSDFLESKKQEILSDEVKSILEEREQKIIHILPSYSDNYAGDDTGDVLTDFKFVNYVEAIIETFGLSYSDSIGIKSLVLLDEFVSQSASERSLETNLFYIPLKLTLTGNKEGLINFLHYIENVGKIYIEGKEVNIYEDRFLTKNGRKILLEGDNRKETYPGFSSYNIYENQIIDLESLKMQSYIDESIQTRDEQDFISFIKNTQGNEKVEAEVKLRFYVKGFPHYKLEGFIRDILDNYETLKKDIAIQLKDTKTRPHILNKLRNVNAYLNEISKDISDIRVSLRRRENLEDLYRRAIDYDTIFTSYRKQLIP